MSDSHPLDFDESRLQQPKGGRAGLAWELLGPVFQELAKTALLLAVLMLTLWGLLEIFRGGATQGAWYERLGRTFADARLDVDGLPIAPRFVPAACTSLAIVLTAAALLAVISLSAGSTFAMQPRWSVLRLALLVVSAVPAFMFRSLGVPREPAWLWAAVCLAIGDLNAAALTAHCYEGVRRELGQPYVRTALAQGLSPWSDLWPRATVIVLAGITARIPHMLGGTVAVEYAFNIHGVGQLALSAVVSPRPNYNVLVWIAALGIVTTRLLSLVQRISRVVLTPERGKTATWSGEGLAAGLATLWRMGRVQGFGVPARRGSGFRVQENAGAGHPSAGPTPPSWLSTAVPPATITHPTTWVRWANRVRAFAMVSGTNRAKLVLAALTAVAGAGLLAVVLWGGSYTMLMTDALFLRPSQAHPLGTNEMGEDVLSKIAQGGRELLLPVVAALAAAVLLGGLFGTWSGLCLGSSVDTFMDLYAELWESVPKLVLVLAALTYMSYEHYTLKLYLLIGIAFAPLVYRAVRNEVGSLRTSLFLEASVALGISRGRIFWTHVVRRHVLPVLCVEGAVLMGYVLLFDAILGYCGVRQYGEVQTWGSLLGTALDELPRQIGAGIAVNPWTVWGPFSAMLLGITGSAIVGDALKSLGRSVRAGQ